MVQGKGMPSNGGIPWPLPRTCVENLFAGVECGTGFLDKFEIGLLIFRARFTEEKTLREGKIPELVSQEFFWTVSTGRRRSLTPFAQPWASAATAGRAYLVGAQQRTRSRLSDR
jgi:hypothetical protein